MSPIFPLLLNSPLLTPVYPSGTHPFLSFRLTVPVLIGAKGPCLVSVDHLLPIPAHRHHPQGTGIASSRLGIGGAFQKDNVMAFTGIAE